MNLAAIVGFLVGALVLGFSMTSASNMSIFWNPEGLAIVMGGVIAATFICYPFADISKLFKSFVQVLKKEPLPVEYYIEEIIYLSQRAMSGSTLKLENELKGIENHFLKHGLGMVVDQYSEERLRSIMESTIIHSRRKQTVQVDMLQTMTKLCPAFGMVGSLIGLIVMFQNIGGDATSIGANIAVAMMSTLYGLLLANLVFSPCAIKIKQLLEERESLMCLIMEGLILVAKKTPPQQVRDELRAFLPAPKWQDVQIRKKKTSNKRTSTKARVHATT